MRFRLICSKSVLYRCKNLYTDEKSRKIRFKKLIPTFLIVVIPFITNCGNKEGVCTGYSDSLNRTYCYDGWTERDCKEYDKEEVNGANWNFYADQTCASRGLSVGSN